MRLIIAAIVIGTLYLIYFPNETIMALWIAASAFTVFFGWMLKYLILALAAFPAIKVVRKAWRG